MMDPKLIQGHSPPGMEDIQDGNNLFPVFLKLESLRLLIVGGGFVGLEKLRAVLLNAPATVIKIVATHICDEIKEMAAENPHIELIEKEYATEDLEETDIVIAAVDDKEVSHMIWSDAKEKGKLINVADTPELCDFYLGSIVRKGNLKIAISTNGKSPTIAKRLKEIFTEVIPEQMDDLLQNMQRIRNRLNGNFADKVNKLNEITKVLVAKQATLEKPEKKKWQRIVQWCLFAFFFMLLGHGLLGLDPFGNLIESVRSIPRYIDGKSFFLMLLTGFFAQMVDGSLGMGYGTISTTFLLFMGVNPAIVSSRVHSARVFSSGVSGYSHHRFGNINKKLFAVLIVPGVIGAIIGATLAFYGQQLQQYSSYVRLPLSIYTLYLGIYILGKAYARKKNKNKVKNAGWLAATGGFLDAFAGGGWGTLVTSTLISKRRDVRYVIGSVCLTEFFVVLASSITFFIFLKHIPIIDVAGLIIGGLIAAPIAARLVGKLPLKAMFIGVGALVIITSAFTFWKAFIPVLKLF